MTVLARDVSNYTVPLTPELLAQWKAEGCELVIVQAIDPPAGYPVGKTREQIQQCLAAGLTVDAYVWLWFDYGVKDIERKLALLDGLPIRQLWLDVEDSAAVRYDQATKEAKIADALAACDARPVTSGERTGIYSGRWFWADRRYAGNTAAFSDRLLWDADYDDLVDTGGFVSYGGWTERAIKQYAGSQPDGTDLNVLSAAEAERLHGGSDDVTDPERQAMQATIDSLVNSLGYIAGDLMAPVVAQKTGTKAVKSLVAGIRVQANAQGIAHA